MNITITSSEFKKYSQEVRNTLLREAVFAEDNNFIEFLLEAEAILEEGMIAAVISNNIEMLNYFLRKGADVSYKENSAFSLAACEGNYEIAKILKEADATPKVDMLHSPLNEGHYKILEMLKTK